jgi:hypothetical protein
LNLAYLTLSDVSSSIHFPANDLIFLYIWVIVHDLYVPYFLYSVISHWARWLFPQLLCFLDLFSPFW